MSSAEDNPGAASASASPRPSGDGVRSLEGLHTTVPVPPETAGFWRNYRAFVGPAVLVSVGYMDPGNWGTDLQAGAQYKYGLLWVVALSSLMAIVMQVARRPAGRRDGQGPGASVSRLLSRVDALAQLAVVRAGHRCLRPGGGARQRRGDQFAVPHPAASGRSSSPRSTCCCCWRCKGWACASSKRSSCVLVATIGGCYFIEIFVLPQTQPEFPGDGPGAAVARLPQEGMIVVAIGIIGATVMPHNLYLHSALVQTRQLQNGRAVHPPGDPVQHDRHRSWHCRSRSSSMRRSWCWRRRVFYGKEA